MNQQAARMFAGIILSLLLLIVLGCATFGGGDDTSSGTGAGALPAQPTPDLEKIVEEIVTKMHEDASAEEIQDLVRASVSDALEAYENSTDAPQFPNVDVHEDDIVAPSHVPSELDVIWEAWEHLNRDYVDREKLDPELATEYAIRGITGTLGDSQTSYVRKEVLSGQFGDVFEGEFQGIGAFVQMNARGSLVIVSPIEGGPADLAGIKPGDIILEVDGESLEGLSTLEAVSKIRGPKDSIARILVKKLGQIDPVLIEIKRAVVPLTSVRLRSEPGEEFMHIRLTDFYPQTAEKLRGVIEQEIEAGAKGLILDLRSNGGGLLSSAVDVASLFIKDGLALYVVDANKRRTDYNINTEGRQFLTDIPMVVLINGGSASASEILAGALQDHDRAKLIGDTSFGKGSVNWLRRLSNGAGLYITVAHWYTGGGLLSSAVDVASLFIKDGLALYVVDANKRRTDYNINTEGRQFLTDIPMVVLINGGSASASEILAGALQDHDRAKLIGDTSFGKGSVNWLRRLSNGAGLYITVAHWYTPDGRLIQGEGVEPDIEVTSRDAQKADVDQLRKAIEELESITGGGSSELNGSS